MRLCFVALKNSRPLMQPSNASLVSLMVVFSDVLFTYILDIFSVSHIDGGNRPDL